MNTGYSAAERFSCPKFGGGEELGLGLRHQHQQSCNFGWSISASPGEQSPERGAEANTLGSWGNESQSDCIPGGTGRIWVMHCSFCYEVWMALGWRRQWGLRNFQDGVRGGREVRHSSDDRVITDDGNSWGKSNRSDKCGLFSARQGMLTHISMESLLWIIQSHRLVTHSCSLSMLSRLSHHV